jgi:amidase
LFAAATTLLGRSINANTTVNPKRLLFVPEAFNVLTERHRAIIEEKMAEIENVLGLEREELSMEVIAEQSSQNPLDDWLDIYRTIQGAEIWSCLGTWIEANNPTFGPRIAKNFQYAKQMDRVKLADCINRRAHLIASCDNLLSHLDLICIPTVPAPPPLKGSVGADRYSSNYVTSALAICSIAGICRLPQLTLPLAELSGMPVGISLLAKHGNDITLLNSLLTFASLATP